jgi:heme exporter protein A
MRLCAIDLACHRGGRDVFAGLSFAVASGQALTITGRNGAGKSSLLRTIVGLVRIAGGKLVLEGGDPELTIAEQAHYLGHQDALKPSLSVAENLRFWGAFLGAKTVDTRSCLDAVGLDDLADLPAAYLSAGQRRRLSIARLISVKRPIWLLDEPTSTLDSAAQQRLAKVMGTHLDEGGLILAATHGPIGLANAQELRLDDIVPSGVAGEEQDERSERSIQAAAAAIGRSTHTAEASRQPDGNQMRS